MMSIINHSKSETHSSFLMQPSGSTAKLIFLFSSEQGTKDIHVGVVFKFKPI